MKQMGLRNGIVGQGCGVILASVGAVYLRDPFLETIFPGLMNHIHFLLS